MKIRDKVLFIQIVALSVILFLCIVSCDGILGGGTGVLEVSISTPSSVSISSFKIHMEGPGGVTRDKNTIVPVESFANLSAGVWSISAACMDIDENILGSGVNAAKIKVNAIERVTIIVNIPTVPPQGEPTPVPLPEIEVKVDEALIANSTGSYNFWQVNEESSSAIVVFTLHNKGPGSVTLTGDPAIRLLRGHTTDFSIISQPSTSVISEGKSDAFSIVFAPGSSGSKNAVAVIYNSGSIPGFEFELKGEGIATPAPTSVPTIPPTIPSTPVRVEVTVVFTPAPSPETEEFELPSNLAMLESSTVIVIGTGGGGGGYYSCGSQTGGCSYWGGGGGAGEVKESYDVLAIGDTYYITPGIGGFGGGFYTNTGWCEGSPQSAGGDGTESSIRSSKGWVISADFGKAGKLMFRGEGYPGGQGVGSNCNGYCSVGPCGAAGAGGKNWYDDGKYGAGGKGGDGIDDDGAKGGHKGGDGAVIIQWVGYVNP